MNAVSGFVLYSLEFRLGSQFRNVEAPRAVAPMTPSLEKLPATATDWSRHSAEHKMVSTRRVPPGLSRRRVKHRTLHGQGAVVQWNWLHATACSSALVASFAYMHNAVSSYFASVVLESASSSAHAAAAVSTAEAVHDSATTVGRSGSSVWMDLTMRLRWIVVPLLMVLWVSGLVVSRSFRLHSPLMRIGKGLVHSVDKLRALHHRHRSSKHQRRRSNAHRRRHSSGMISGSHDIDEMDTLIVTSLSRERKMVSHNKDDLLKPNPTAQDPSLRAQIVLHPREGALGGRHRSNHIVSDDPFVSRYHFQIQYDPMEKEYFLQDLGSTTGTFLFIKPETPKRLHVHDRVKLGETEFEVVAIDQNYPTGTPFLRICFTEGPLMGIGQTIGKTAVTLGRRSSNALCITDDGSISGRHSVISYQGDGFYITDLNSTNGTAIRLSASGQQSRRRYLLHGDIFGVGSNRFLVEYTHHLDVQDQRRAVALPAAIAAD